MKKLFNKSALTFILLILPLAANVYANECRDEKLECKDDAKEDGEYTSLERAQCRGVKLLCKRDA